MRKLILLISLTMIMAGLVQVPALKAAPGIAVHLEPNLVSIGASYNGTHVSLSGEVPRNAEVLVRLSGDTTDDGCLKKGRVMGILWMNTGKVTFHHIPRIYLLYCPGGISAADLTEGSQWRDLGVGFGALKKQTEISPEGEDLDVQFREYLKLKEKQGLYGVHENAVTYQNAGEGTKTFHADLAVPCAVPPGSYTVTAFVLEGGKIVETVDQPLKIEEAGLPAMISSMAFNHGILYGVLSILIAIFAGLLMGAFFKKGGEAH